MNAFQPSASLVIGRPQGPVTANQGYQIVALYLDDPDSAAALVAMPIDGEHGSLAAAPSADPLTE